MDAQGGRIPQADLDRAAATIKLSDLIRRTVTLKEAGKEWSAPCPFHNEKSPSFFVNDDKGFFHCFGCGAHGNHFGWLMRAHGVTFREAYRMLAGDDPTPAAQIEKPKPAPSTNPFDDDEDLADTMKARAIYMAGKPVLGTVAHQYLRARKLVRIPPDWRFAPSLRCVDLDRSYPALIVPLLDYRGGISAIQRIWIDPATLQRPVGPDGKKAKKKTYGTMGAAAVRVGRAWDRLGISEGPEKAVAVAQMFAFPCWASCGAARLASIWIPESVKHLVIFADSDETGLRLAREAAEDYEERGFRVRIELPGAKAKDFSDELEQGGA